MTQEQAKNLTFPCKVRVTKAGRNTYWYSGAIGGIFKVVGFTDNNKYLIVVCDGIAIDISDCELYEEPKEVNPQPDEQPEKVNLSPDEIYQAWKDGKVVKFMDCIVNEIYKFTNGSVFFSTEGFNGAGKIFSEDCKDFTIEEPVEAMFTPIFEVSDTFNPDPDYNKMNDALKGFDEDKNYTCILEHHKISGKWVFVKAHKIE